MNNPEKLTADYKESREAMGEFLVELALLDAGTTTAVLRDLCTDNILVDHLPETVEFSKRLKLIKWIAKRHDLSSTFITHLNAAVSNAKKLAENRNIVAHNPPRTGVSAGVQKKRNDQTLPDAIKSQVDFLALAEAIRKSVIATPEIKEWLSATVLLNRKMMYLSIRIRTCISGQPDPGWPPSFRE